MENTPQTKADLEKLITDEVEESFNLEYKGADAIQNTDGKKKEIAKDVSSFANSAGGVIIYGIKEFDEEEKRYLPERITPINRTQYTKEWLEQIINSNISPKIEGLKIYPVTLDDFNEVAYVVEIPQGTTAHQNTKDHRYYRRYNFEAIPMLDYEIKDIMNRIKHPLIEIRFEIQKRTFKVNENSFFPKFPDVFNMSSGNNIVEPENKTELTLKIF
ncbi:MAG TPA: ATP-binding protein, partial [Ignavibacteria bacterium]